MSTQNAWWKWGDPKKAFHLDDYPKFKAFLEDKWQTQLKADFSPDYSFTHITEETFSLSDFKHTFPELDEKHFNNSKTQRLTFSQGKSYQDIIRTFTNKIESVPDFILSPENEKQISYIFAQCKQHNIAIIPFSGGTNVTGAFNFKAGQLSCAINLRKMAQCIDIDTTSHTATFEAGILGPELEAILNKKGFTLGHFPQSFEFSTLGGWIATRSAGQESGQYGKIEDMVLGLTAVTPNGIISHEDFPKHASGIDIHPLFIGSEGTLGIITQAKVKITPKPTKYKWIVGLFKNFESGTQAVRKLIQSGVHPGICRLSDRMETKMLSKMSHSEKTGLKKWLQDLYKKRLVSKGYGEPSILLLRLDTTAPTGDSAVKHTKKLIQNNEGILLPPDVSSNWESNRFTLPYLRDTMIEHRILIDTFETVTYWSNLTTLYHAVFQALESESDFFKNGGILFCHISHAYETGASLYFTLIAPQEKGREQEQWKAIKSTVSETIIANKGAISHHHGVGKDHQKWYLQKLHPEAQKLLMSVKKHLDPDDLMNPGNLFDETPAQKQTK